MKLLTDNTAQIINKILTRIYETYNILGTLDIYRILINNIIRFADLKLKFCARGFVDTTPVYIMYIINSGLRTINRTVSLGALRFGCTIAD